MALIKCPECGREVSDKSKQCIHCGYPLNECETSEKSKNCEKEDEQLYQVILTDAGNSKVQLIRTIRDVTEWSGLSEAKALTDNLPSRISTGISKKQAERIKKSLENVGAVVEIKKASEKIVKENTYKNSVQTTQSNPVKPNLESASTTQNGSKKNGGCGWIIAILVLLGLMFIGSMDSGNDGDRTCAWCNGTGYSGNGATNATEYVFQKTPCKHCNGKGTY